MQQLWQTSYLSNGENYLEQLYEAYLQDPTAVNEAWREYFKTLGGAPISHAAVQEYFLQLATQPPINMAVNSDVEHASKQALVNQLVDAYRKFGHWQTQLDPLGLTEQLSVPELSPEHYGFSVQDMTKTFLPYGFGDGKPRQLKDLLQQLKQVYCHTIGMEYMYIDQTEEIRWLQQRIEDPRYHPPLTVQQREHILDCLTAAEGLEKYLGNKYVGQKRFGLEGGESLIPLLDEIIQQGGQTYQLKEVAIGMPHRGRLNVLVNIFGKSPENLFNEFEGKINYEGRSGDVKYHLGFSSDIQTPGGPVHLALAFNPSHLEIVSPVAIGFVRARQQLNGLNNQKKILSIQIHGDAAFAGQGVVMETFCLSQTAGYGTAGSIHIVINNQIGFTTDPVNSRSTYYCTDIAKMVQAPILHVNGDDPEAVVFAAKLALDYRQQFAKDIVIDLICYRRLGHNEADEPAATQPIMYQKIRQLKTTRQLYAEKLAAQQIVSLESAENKVRDYRDALDARKNPLPRLVDRPHLYGQVWKKHLNQSLGQEVNTGCALSLLQQLVDQLQKLPEGFQLQAQVAKMLADQQKMATGELPLNWGFAEKLAFATLLSDGFDVRLSGQDCGRATFAHRHAVLHDYQNGKIYIPLQHISKNNFTVIDSILSEEAVLAFEYGYATAAPQTLVMWEAQYGDFANGAQVVIDQFISAGEQKWGQLAALTMLLPHGYEGAGPEHSSARLERYLQLCAQDNMQVCVPSSPAQYFHLLRRQMLQPARKPLIVMSPKSFLRHKLAVSSLTELSEGKFQCVIPEVEKLSGKNFPRIIFCSGKIYYELLERRRELQLNVPIIRIEQLYPFPDTLVQNQLAQYKKISDVIWCQEEPHNQGAWKVIYPWLSECLQKGQQLHYVGRSAMAAPAGASAKIHAQEQQLILDNALQGNLQ